MPANRFTTYKKVLVMCALTVITIGVGVIIGWIAHMPALTQLNTNSPSVKMNAAIGFVLAGISILAIFYANHSPSYSNRYRIIGRGCALALFFLGSLTLIEWLFATDLHIDRLFFKASPGGFDHGHPGRMSPINAVVEATTALALWLLSSKQKTDKVIVIGQSYAIFGCVVGTLALIGYLLDAEQFYAIGNTTAIAAPACFSIFILSIGLLFLEPERGLMRTFTSPTKTGQLLRRLVPLSFFVPIIFCLIRYKGQELGVYDNPTGIAIMCTFCIVLCQSVIYWLAKRFQQVESALLIREEQLHGQNKLLDLTHDAIMVRGLNGTITFWNRGAEEMYGYLKSEAIGASSHSLLQTKFPMNLQDIESIVLEKDRWEGELIHTAKNQERIVVASRWSLERDENGKPSAVLEINNDIRAVKESEKLVSEFYSTVSHELRTPLTSIKGTFSLLQGGRAGELSDRAKELITIGFSESDRLIRLITNLLDIKKIEAGKLELQFENIEPEQLIQQTISSVETFALEYKVQLAAEICDNDSVQGDKDKLIQVLTNLISNAIKFSPEGDIVTIISSRENGAVCFAVKDNGPGIDSRNVAKLFRMFQQSNASNQPKGGSGLGLAVCKSLIEQHGGSIGVDSKLGKGSTFWFCIPCAPATK